MIFHDREQAGQLLAEKLQKFKDGNSVVLALPRGGVPIAAEVAKSLNIPLEILTVRKIGAPFQPELAVGALCEDDEPIWNESILSELGLHYNDLEPVITEEADKIKHYVHLFRHDQEFPDLTNKVAIVVDDGLATGATMLAAIHYLKKKGADKIIVAVPVAAGVTAQHLRDQVDQVIVLSEEENLRSVGEWYKDFTQVEDNEVLSFLRKNQNACKGSLESRK